MYIEGRLRTNNYQDKDGIQRYSTEIVADQMTMLGSRNDNGGGGGNFQEPSSAASGGNYGSAASSTNTGNSGGGASAFQNDEPDDLPF
ncbi:hypothetical protein GCM10028895_28830 [Pontibacter rugosus]